MEYIKNVDEEENPDYSYIKGLFKKAADSNKIQVKTLPLNLTQQLKLMLPL